MVALIVLLFIVFVVLACSVHSGNSSREEFSERNLYSIANKAWDCKTYKSANNHLEELIGIQLQAEISHAPESIKRNIQYHIDYVNVQVEDLAKTSWMEKVDPILEEFIEYYLDVVNYNGGFCCFESLNSSKSKCIRRYEKYYSTQVDGNYYINKKDYFREKLTLYYEPCMNSKHELEERLNAVIEQSKPEKLRKKKLTSEMLYFILEHESVLRSELLKHNFEGFIPEEIRYCYKDLLYSYRIVEYKIGSRYFVTLSDTEKEKFDKKNAKKLDTISKTKDDLQSPIPPKLEEKKSYTVEEAIQYLSSHGKSYCDNTPKGGRFWILYDKEIEVWINAKTIDGKLPRYSSASGALHGAPGWYV